jgi:hypothetical protein
MPHDPTNQNFITPFGGRAQVLVNRSGGAIRVGEVVELNAAGERGFTRATAGSSNPLGVAYENVVDGSECWVVTDGPQDVLLDSSGGCSYGQPLCMSPTEAGRVRVGAIGVALGTALDVAGAGGAAFAFLNTAQVSGADTIWTDVTAFGAIGDGVHDDTAAIQAAITAAAGGVVYMPEGRYVVTSTLTWYNTADANGPGLQLFGAGMDLTVIENRVVGGPALDVDGSAGAFLHFQRGAKLQDFSIIAASPAPVGGYGLRIRANWYMSLNDVVVSGHASHGIRIVNSSLDSDSSGFVGFKNVEMMYNGGYGLSAEGNAVLGSAIAFFEFSGCYVVGNSLGGIHGALVDPRIVDGSIAYNGGPGLWITRPTPGTRPIIEHIEFDTNAVAHIKIDLCYGARIAYNNFKATGAGAAFAPAASVVLGVDVGNAVFNATLEANAVRLTNPTSQPHTAFVVGANAYQTRIKDTFWWVFAAPAVKFSDGGSGTTIIDENLREGDALLTKTTTTNTSYTPDMLLGVYHRVVVNAGPNFTVNDPINGVAQGRELLLDVINVSGGGLNVSFGANIQTSGFGAMNNGKRRTARFIYEPNGADWIQIGDWSPEFP